MSREFRRQAGQMAIVGFAGHTIPPDVKLLAREFDLGGKIGRKELQQRVVGNDFHLLCKLQRRGFVHGV